MAEAILVLGHKLKPDNTPSDDLKSRIDKTVEYWRETGIPMIMPCGGITRDRTRTEAEVMREMLIERGVPESVIHLENGSRTTAENIENAINLLGKDATVALVTSEYHIEYALAECEYYGLKAYPVPAVTADEDYREHERKVCTFFMNMNRVVRDEAKRQGVTEKEMMNKLHARMASGEDFVKYIREEAKKRGLEMPEGF